MYQSFTFVNLINQYVNFVLYSTGGCATATCLRSVIVCRVMRLRWSLVTPCWSLSFRRCVNSCLTSSTPRKTKCRPRSGRWFWRTFHGRCHVFHISLMILMAHASAEESLLPEDRRVWSIPVPQWKLSLVMECWFNYKHLSVVGRSKGDYQIVGGLNRFPLTPHLLAAWHGLYATQCYVLIASLFIDNYAITSRADHIMFVMMTSRSAWHYINVQFTY